MDCFFKDYLSEVDWLFYEDNIEQGLQGVNESLFTLGNGYIGSRGIYEESAHNLLVGTFFAGVYDRATFIVPELMNAPNPFHLTIYSSQLDFRLGVEKRALGVYTLVQEDASDEDNNAENSSAKSIHSSKDEKLDLYETSFERHRRVLDLRKGLLVRHTVFNHTTGDVDYQSIRFISNKDVNIAVMRIVITSLTQDAHFSIQTDIDTNVKNSGIILERHVRCFSIFATERINTFDYLSVESLDHENEIAYGQQIFLDLNGNTEPISHYNFEFELKKGCKATITKIITCHHANNLSDRRHLKEMVTHSLQIACDKGFAHLLHEHINAFENRWQQYDIKIVGDTDMQSIMRLNLYHLLIANHLDVKDISIGAKMLTGEGYKGHVFWETELLLFPCYLHSEPILARQLLEYRFNRLPAAKKIAADKGYKGALYPWESAHTGFDVTPPWTEDLDGTIKVVHTGKQSLHVNLAIFHAIYVYFNSTQDVEFMLRMGLLMIIEMARFWKSRVVHNRRKNLYKIKQVMGPDEFHDNVKNNAYTNKLVAWSLEKTVFLINKFQKEFPEETTKILKVTQLYAREKDRLKVISTRMWVPIKRKIILQFDGYLKLKLARTPSLDVFGIPKPLPDMLVIDFYKTQFIKQADVILLLLLLPTTFDRKTIEANFHFYNVRTLHKSSWSPPIYSAVAAQLDYHERAYHYFGIALNTDKKNIFGNSKDGMHAPALGGSWISFIYGFCGLRVIDDKLLMTPHLPILWQFVSFKFFYMDFILHVTINQHQVKIFVERAYHPWLSNQLLRKKIKNVRLKIGNRTLRLFPNEEYSIDYF
jgi:kojibiose phosphorylase